MKRLLFIFLIFIATITGGCLQSHYTVDHHDTVTLYVWLPLAKEVEFASSLDQYILHPAKKQNGWRWSIEVPAGQEFTYFYRVDGSLYLPKCRYRETDDFGQKNCIYQTNM